MAETRSDRQSVNFRINGKKFTVYPDQSENTTPSSVLVDYIRHEAGLTGTKYMCREGGCGACVVTATVPDPGAGAEGKDTRTVSVNSCLVPVFAADGWDISTIESLGNHRDGYDVLQNRMVGFSGTQCGYCTPGVIMNMHSLMKTKPELTAKEIEDALDGNICRCTGFRPILDAFKSLAVDVPDSIKKKCAEMEEATGKVCQMKGACCSAGRCLKNEDIEDCASKKKLGRLRIETESGQKWFKPNFLIEALGLLQEFTQNRVEYRVVAGNTSTGIFKEKQLQRMGAYVDVKDLPELQRHEIADGRAVLGGGATLTFVIAFLKKISSINGFEYGSEIAKHLSRVANTSVRNIGTIAGNLMIKHEHNEFPSDVFTTLESLQRVMLNIASATSTNSVSLLEFLKLDMAGRLIVSIELPSLPPASGYHVRRFKISKRHQNAHAYVNAGFLFRVDSSPSANFRVLEQPALCFAGINPGFIHATRTEEFLTGKCLGDTKVVQEALELLEKELEPDFKRPDARPEYRRILGRNLLYKTILGLLGNRTTSRLTSGGPSIEYKVFSGKQTYDTHKEQWPLTQPVPKLEAAKQCSGESEFTNDIPKQPGELFGAFVLAKVGNCDLEAIDASEALKIPDVVAFISAKDIPGRNNFQAVPIFPIRMDQEVFVDKKVHAVGQAIGMVLAETRAVAFEGAALVKATYTNKQKPLIGFEEGIAAAKAHGYYDKLFFFKPRSSASASADPQQQIHKVKGHAQFPSQVHFAMEPHVTLCVPKEGGLEIYAATQWMDGIQAAVAEMLAIQNNKVTVQVRRLGGGFGSKGSPATHVACAAALGAHVTNRPVRVVLDIDTNFQMLGKRVPYSFEYEVSFDDTGRVLGLDAKALADNGYTPNDPDLFIFLQFMQNAYKAIGWAVDAGFMASNTVPNTYCRAPGSAFGIAAIETVLEHVAHVLGKDPLDVRMANLIREGDEVLGIPGLAPSTVFKGENMIPKLVKEIKTNADYVQRKAALGEFNALNRWRKRGLSVVPMRYPQHYFTMAYPSYVAVYHADGTVVLSTGGVEMGQGLNTKAAQIAAHVLGVPLEKVTVRPMNNTVSPNAMVSAGGLPSELVAYATHKACDILLARLAPIMEKLGSDASWEEVIKAAHAAGVDLRAHYLPNKSQDDIREYEIWGLTMTEVELDVLTGEYKILRVDLIEDAGKPMSPEIDIGQVEGSLVFGLGMWTTEELQYDRETGELLTTNTWDYKPPLAKNSPEDLRVTLLQNSVNSGGVHGSKSVGEPVVCMSVGVVFALKAAIDSARKDAGTTEYYQLEAPLTPETIMKYTLIQKKHLQL